MGADTNGSGYGLASGGRAPSVAAPDLPYLPPRPKSYHPRIGLIGCGGISEYHLRAYRAMGLEVAALCDVDLARAEAEVQVVRVDIEQFIAAQAERRVWPRVQVALGGLATAATFLWGAFG